MAFNKPLLITVLCLTIPASLWAQNTETHFIQRLTWIGDEYATRYEVIIEKEEDGEYKKVLQKFTTAFFIEVSLPHGKYRYQVIPYDFFDLPVPEKEWMDFEVKSQPTIMVNQDKPEIKNEVILPSPEPGTTKENKNKFDIYLGLAWIPLLPIYGENESFGENMSSYGAGLRLAVLSVKQKLLNLGMEGCSSWLVSTGDQPVQSLTFDLNFVLRFSDDKGILNSKTGAGVSIRSGTSPIPADSQYAFHANFGASLIFWLSMRLYLELGMEYVQFFTDSGFLRPSVALEYRF